MALLAAPRQPPLADAFARIRSSPGASAPLAPALHRIAASGTPSSAQLGSALGGIRTAGGFVAPAPISSALPRYGDTSGGDGSSGDATGGAAWDPMSDPGYLASLGQEQLGMSQLDANLTEARRQAIIRFGDASLADVAGFGLDPQAADFAKQNYLSGNADLARLDKAHDLRRQAIINQLASHGILGSGDLGYLQGQEDQGAGNALYDAKNKVLDYLRGLNDTYLDRKNQLRAATVAALQGAYQFGMANPGLYASGGAGGGGGGSGGGQSGSFEMPFIPAGYSGGQTTAAANAYAAAHGYSPHMVMQEGTVTYQNGQPGIYVKYNTPQGSSTEWTPLGSGGGAAAPAAAIGAPRGVSAAPTRPVVRRTVPRG